MVAAELRRQIVLGKLKQDDQLPSENALMEQFGVSRPTLREAFRILESEGAITVRRGVRGGAVDLRRSFVRGDLAGGQALPSESDYLLQNTSLTTVLDLLG